LHLEPHIQHPIPVLQPELGLCKRKRTRALYIRSV
jgi:hypothetical protein